MKKAFYAKPYTIKSQRPTPRKRIRITSSRTVTKDARILETKVDEHQLQPEKECRYHCPAIVEVDGKATKCKFKSDRWKTMQAHILERHIPPEKDVLKKELEKSMSMIKNKPWTNRP